MIFENFLKFSKRRRAVPLRPIWTIMVAAKLDQTTVLVTKFRQNRFTLMGRSAGQRQTDRQTDRHTDRQTRLKISLSWPFRFAIGPITERIEYKLLSLTKPSQPPNLHISTTSSLFNLIAALALHLWSPSLDHQRHPRYV